MAEFDRPNVALQLALKALERMTLPEGGMEAGKRAAELYTHILAGLPHDSVEATGNAAIGKISR